MLKDIAYLPLGGLLPRPPPDGFPVVLGPLSGRPELLDIIASLIKPAKSLVKSIYPFTGLISMRVEFERPKA